MESLLLTYSLLYPVAAITLLTLHRDSTIAAYLIPRFLREPRYPKLLLRQAGTAWILLGLWTIIAPFYLLQVISVDSLKNSGLLTALFAFVFPVTGATLTLAGFLQLFKGIFSANALASPAVETAAAIEPNQLDRYLRRASAYLRINLGSLALTVGAPLIEAAFGLEPTGWVVLTNVSFLITFILTVHRLRFYATRSVMLMGAPEKSFIPPLGVLKIFSMWILAYRLEKLADSRMHRDPMPDQPTRPTAPTGSR